MVLVTTLWYDAVTQNVYFSPELICRFSGSHTGVVDQLLVVEAPYDPELDFIIVFLMQMDELRSVVMVLVVCSICEIKRSYKTKER